MMRIPEKTGARQLSATMFRRTCLQALCIIAIGVSGATFAAKSDVHQFERVVQVLLPVPADKDLGQWAQNFVVLGERYLSKGLKLANEPDSNGKDAWRKLSNRGPDGHTAMFGATYIWESGLLDTKLSDTVGGSRVACLITEIQYVLIAKKSSPLKTWQDVLVKARGAPDTLRVAGNFEGLVAAYNMASQMNVDLKYFKPQVGYKKTLSRGVADLAVVETFRILSPKYKNYRAIASLGSIPMPDRAFTQSPNMMTPETLGFKGMTFPRWIAMHPDTSDANVKRMSDAFATMISNKRYVHMMEKFGLPTVFKPFGEAREAIEEVQENLHWLAAGLARENIRFNMRTMSSR